MQRKRLNELRDKAKAKRDHVVEQAEAEYTETLRQIADLEKKLFDESPEPDHRIGESISDLILAVCPKDRVFTAREVDELVRAADPSRKFNLTTVQCHLPQLCRKKKLKRVSASRGPHPATYAVAGLKVPEGPPERSLVEWAVFVLDQSDRPMKPIEILLAMIDAGYVVMTSRDNVVRNIARAMERDERFIGEKDGEWSHRSGGR